jgi:predicted transcriptional regulator
MTLIHDGVREALVDESSLGLVSITDITRAVANGRADLKVRDIMTHDFLTIDSNELIFEAVKVLGRSGSSQLVVLDSGVPWGIITPADLIGVLTPN